MELWVKFRFPKNLQWGAIFLKVHSYFYAQTISLNNYEALITLLNEN